MPDELKQVVTGPVEQRSPLLVFGIAFASMVMLSLFLVLIRGPGLIRLLMSHLALADDRTPMTSSSSIAIAR